FALFALTRLTAATAAQNRAGDGSDSDESPCPEVQCWNSVVPANSATATAILGLLNIVLTDLTILVGLTCSPITVIDGSNH
ncbi:hypothetical protein L218DRAFT_873884, partial [Marasmius fiardii PR-910]